jgi:uncharacterized membrane protein
MNLIFAKLYEEYIRKNDPAKFNITLYISIVYFFLIFAIALPFKTFIDKKIYDDQFHYEKSTIMTVVFVLLTVIISLVHYIYSKKRHIETLTRRHKENKINKTLLYLIVIVTPLALLILAGITTVYLNGGEVLGNRIHGILE